MPPQEPADAIRERIERDGPISFADFMELALYGEGGFYEEPPVGERGDFVTGPHVHPLFGRLLARGLSQAWDAMDVGSPLRVIELGAGDGTLAEQLRDAIPDIDYMAVEVSPGARASLAERGFSAATSIGTLGDLGAALVIANELFDNLPFHRVRRSPEGLVEIRVRLDSGAFVEAMAPCHPALAAVAPPLGEGEEAAIPLAGMRLVERLAERLDRGHMLFIDYERIPGQVRGGVHGYRDHRVVPQVLADPGSTDITAPVDMDAIAMAARSADLDAHQRVTQRDALLTLGFRDEAEAMSKAQAEAMDSGDGRAALRALDARNRAAMLVDPAGPGALVWLTLSTRGTQPPPWVAGPSSLP